MGNFLNSRSHHDSEGQTKTVLTKMKPLEEVEEEEEERPKEEETEPKGLESALDLMHRLPPQQIEKNLTNIIELQPALSDDLLQTIEPPLKVVIDKESGREYLLCDYNLDGESYRSPWTNEYDPPLEDGTKPSERLRILEIEANHVFGLYRDMYFEGGVSSVYLWDLDTDNSFAGIFLIKKTVDDNEKLKGYWDSSHVFEIHENEDNMANYKLTSTAIICLETAKANSGWMNTGGRLSKQSEKDVKFKEKSDHIAQIGRMIEDMENKALNAIKEINYSLTKDVVNSMRHIHLREVEDERNALRAKMSRVTMAPDHLHNALQNDLAKAMLRRNVSHDK